MSFGATVRLRRRELEIGLNDFADRIGISAAYWSRIERERKSRLAMSLSSAPRPCWASGWTTCSSRPNAFRPTCGETCRRS